jgi:hypothetical protein
MNARNNINGIGDCDRDQVLTLTHQALTNVQETLVRKLVAELQDCDNLYYEICNEPYVKKLNPQCAAVSDAWQARIATVIVEAEKELGVRHLIAQNIANGSCRVEQPDASVSIFNFHYSNPPESVALNYDRNCVIADDETGFKGCDDLPYRADAWDFLLAGGAVYSHLDYSFTASHPDGTFPFKSSPGGGGPALRRQLAYLKQVMDQLPLLTMKPANEVILAGVPGQATARCLAEPGQVYMLYVRGGRHAELKLDLPAGRWQVEWLDPQAAKTLCRDVLAHRGAAAVLSSPPHRDEVALRLMRLAPDNRA